MENMKFCQSCSMPLMQKDQYGTNKDGSQNDEYCAYCYKDGAFTTECTMDEMIENCVPHMVSANAEMSEDAARNQMKQFFPQLKRWRS